MEQTARALSVLKNKALIGKAQLPGQLYPGVMLLPSAVQATAL
jgi:hypothetical protein